MIGKKIPNRGKTSSKASRIGGLSDYIRAPEKTNEQEKCAYSKGRGFLTESHQGQRAEMVALAQESVLSNDPINHYVLSWKEGEIPTPQQVEQALDLVLEQMGMQSHQVIYGLHSDTDNYHVHIAINRVNPETFRLVEINKGFDIEALHQAVARIENAQGWQPEKNARYQVQGAGLTRTGKSKPAKNIGGRTADMEVRTGEKSAKRIGIEEAGPIIRAANSWRELHAGLAAVGMRFEREGSGAKVYVGDVGVKASDVDRNGSIGKLQKRLGPFESANQEKPNVYTSFDREKAIAHARNHGCAAGDRMQRLSECRMANAEKSAGSSAGVLLVAARPRGRHTDGVRRAGYASRDTGRSEPLKPSQPGWLEYTAGRKAEREARARRSDDLKTKHATEREALADRQKAERADALGGTWKNRGQQLNAMRSVLAAKHAAEKLEQREQHKAERQAFSEQYRPFPSYEDFLIRRGEPELADRWRYKDNPEQQPCRIHGKKEKLSYPRDIRDYEHHIVGRDVAYRLRGTSGEAFIDRGKKIDVLDSKNPAAVTAALQLAAQKFGGKVELTGTDEYKRLCVGIALKYGIKIVNGEMQPQIAAEKQRIAQQRAAQRHKPAPSAQAPAQPPHAPKAPPMPSLAEQWGAQPAHEMVGAVVAVEGRTVIQSAGRGRYVVHEMAAGSPMPVVSPEVQTIRGGVLEPSRRGRGLGQ